MNGKDIFEKLLDNAEETTIIVEFYNSGDGRMDFNNNGERNKMAQ